MEYRRSRPEDFDAIVRLADDNYIDRLSPDERREGGYLSKRFHRDDIARMDREIGVVVAVENGAVIGFLCAEWLEGPDRPPLIAAMARTFRESTFEGKLGAEWEGFVSGPICIAAEHRGTGVRRKLDLAIHDVARGKYEVGVSFIAFNNSRSYRVTQSRNGPTDIGAFELGGERYHVVAYRVPES